MDQSVHVQSYHSICCSYTSDGKQDSCIRKIYKLSIMLTSPAVRYAPAPVEIEPSAISTGNWVCGGITEGLWWVKLPSRRKPRWRFEKVPGGQK